MNVDTIKPNEPPKDGTSQNYPRTGVAYTTTFTFKADKWVSMDKPLKYRWKYYLSSSDEFDTTKHTVLNNW